MWIDNPAMTAWFNKSGIYFSVDVGVVEPTIKLHTMVWYKYHKGNKENGIKEGKGLYNEQDQILNNNKQ